MTENETRPEFALQCNGGAGCVIVERIAECVVLRDSKNPTQPGLVFSEKEYADFRRRVLQDSRYRTVLRFATTYLHLILSALQQIIN